MVGDRGEPGKQPLLFLHGGPGFAWASFEPLEALADSGRYDEATPAVAQTVQCGISGSDWVLFEHSGHFPHLEETERYLQVLDQFLNRVEAQG